MQEKINAEMIASLEPRHTSTWLVNILSLSDIITISFRRNFHGTFTYVHNTSWQSFCKLQQDKIITLNLL